MKKTFALLGMTLALAGAPLHAEAGTGTSVVPINQFKAKNFSQIYGMEGFSDQLLSMHFKLYEGYVKNTNLLQDKLTELVSQGRDRTPEYAGLKRMFGWEFDGMRLHEYYFGNLGGKGKVNSDSPIYRKIIQEFESYAKWKQDFVATGMMRGIGWVILYFDDKTGRLTNTWINEHDLGHLTGNAPLLVMDVFEHAYITEYGLDRNKYIQVFFQNIDWDEVNKRFTEAKGD